MDIANNAVAGLCDWIGRLSFTGHVLLAVAVVGIISFLYYFAPVGIMVIPDDDEPYEAWMDEELWEECRREERRI